MYTTEELQNFYQQHSKCADWPHGIICNLVEDALALHEKTGQLERQWTQTPPSTPGLYLYVSPHKPDVHNVMKVILQSDGRLLCRWSEPEKHSDRTYPYVDTPEGAILAQRAFWYCGPIPAFTPAIPVG
jgi:hypothetical protein